MNTTDPRVDAFLRHVPQWREELTLLRSIMLTTDLVEDYKWGQPCYTHNGKNLVLLGGFKGSFVVSFFNGVLLSDPQNILEFAGPNSKTAKLIRFTHIEQIKPREDFLRAYIAEAIVHNVVDRKPDVWTPQPVSIPNELETMFQALPALKTAFYALTPGRQRGYLMHFVAAKQSATRRARIEKHVSSIMAGKGLHD
ncbi:MAG: YdeI/OmpD-associated family protein [Ignavibacteria bacterium]|jgi:uncharacterized protein YdeI (YjbR/CyaY-like superfamily)